MTKREDTYDYDYVMLFHDRKTYSISTKDDYGVKYEIRNGWLIYENSELSFAITNFANDKLEYIDMYGEKHFELRYKGQENIPIPSNYTLEE